MYSSCAVSSDRKCDTYMLLGWRWRTRFRKVAVWNQHIVKVYASLLLFLFASFIFSHFFLGPLHSVTAARSGQAIIGCTVWINCCADESPNILLVAYDPCWAMQHLSLHWLKDRVCKAKHGAFFFFDDCELLDPEPNRGDGLNTLTQTQEANVQVVLLVSVEAHFEVQDRVASCVHLEEITPTLTFSLIAYQKKSFTEEVWICSA